MLEGIRSRWRELALDGRRSRADRDLASTAAVADVRAQVTACLEARGGEASAHRRAVALGTTYLGLSDAGRRRFLLLLADELGTVPGAVDAAAAALATAAEGEPRRRAEAALREALVPRRVELLRQFTAVPEGVKFLVDLRADCLRLADEAPALRDVAEDLRALLRIWFDPGFLELQRVTWDSPASLLERVARYEAVHAVRSWDDLKNRLAEDRRLFAFFHPSMPGEPLIFVEVALVRGLSDSIEPLLDQSAPRADALRAETAIFYSISNTQAGLVGISLGGLLIKQVVDELRRELPRLRTFATLSPLPGFRAWLDARAQVEDPLSAEERRALATAIDRPAADVRLADVLAAEPWLTEPRIARAVTGPLVRLAAVYLLTARRPDGRVLDPVAHFHLGNGARIERIDYLADATPKGIEQAYGLMVNYRYDLEEIEELHEAYRAERTISASGAVLRLARDEDGGRGRRRGS